MTYRYPCVVDDPTNSSSVVVVGVTSDSTLQINRVDISNINNPVPHLLSYQKNTTAWSPDTEKLCVLYPRRARSTATPVFYMRQFGLSAQAMYSTDMGVDGTVPFDPYDMDYALASPKLYSITGSFDIQQWITARAASDNIPSGNPWVANELVNDEILVSASSILQERPAPDALLSVGTYLPATTMPVFGHLTVIDASGTNGIVYTVVSLHKPQGSGVNIQALNSPVIVNMNNITLTKAAYSITMGATGYIIDEAPDHSTVLYSISPNSTAAPTLYPVTVNGNVPQFIPGRASTVMGSNKLLLFGGLLDNSPTTLFHVFDTSARTWSGPNLVSPYIPGSAPIKTNNIAAIVGGVVGGVVLLALLSFFGFRRWRIQRHRVVIPNRDSDLDPLKGQEAVVMTDTSQQPQHHPLPPVAPASHLYQQDQNVGAYYDPNVRVPETRATNHAATGNAWVANDLEWTGPYATPDHFASPILRQIIAPDALPSIGTCSPTTAVLVLGHMAEFDASGTKGIVYITEISIHLQEITSSVEVNMNNIALTEAAYSIAMGATGYIIDQHYYEL
ncbi:hypothetical protein BGW41_003712 [Actinomortierella wolfii]|nr:hypothetical protein BGW41_003712 [Actinomortierella wolfii]